MLYLSRRVFGARIAAVPAFDFGAFCWIGRVLKLEKCIVNLDVVTAGHLDGDLGNTRVMRQ